MKDSCHNLIVDSSIKTLRTVIGSDANPQTLLSYVLADLRNIYNQYNDDYTLTFTLTEKTL